MLEVLDTAGQEEYTALRDQWIRDGEGFVLVYSINSRASFSRIRNFHKQILRVKESAASSPPNLPGTSVPMAASAVPAGPAPVMLVANKIDRNTEREVSTQEGSALAKEIGCDFIETSAKLNTNVEKAFFDTVRQLRKLRANAAKGTARSGSGSSSARSDGKSRRDRKAKDKCVIL